MNLIDVVGTEIRSRGYQRVALFGTRFVVESRLFGMLEGVDVVVPDQVEAIHSSYMQIVAGETGPKSTLSRITRELPVDAIVLAGTDLSLVFNMTNTDFPHVDCTQVHIQAILRELSQHRAE